MKKAMALKNEYCLWLVKSFFSRPYVDRFKAKAYEYRMRIKALESVTDSKYSEIRKACVDLLLKEINEY